MCGLELFGGGCRSIKFAGHAVEAGTVETARQLRLRPGWYPDPDGADCYRRYDGVSWLDDVRPVDATERERFERTQRALRKRIDDVEDALRRRAEAAEAPRHPGVRRPVDVPAVDPGGPLGMLACTLSIVQLWPLGLLVARASRRRSNAAGLPRSVGASLAIAIAGLDVAIWMLLVVAVVMGSR